MALRLLTRPGCCLCESFRQQWYEAFPGVHLRLCDVDGDALLRARYGDQIPVLIDDKGEAVCSAHFDRDACATALARPRQDDA